MTPARRVSPPPPRLGDVSRTGRGAAGVAVRPCAVDGCAGRSSADAPVPLCPDHLRVAAEWMGVLDGVADVLPSPCRLCGARSGIRYPSGWLCSVCEWPHGELPDDELAPPRVDVVYVIRLGDRVKIGTSANPRRRFAALRHDEVLAFERGGRALERRRHERFAPDRIGTSEWFWYSPRLRDHVAALAAGVDDPWDLYARWMSEALALRG